MGDSPSPDPPETFRVTVEFCGGLEQLTKAKAKTLALKFSASSRRGCSAGSEGGCGTNGRAATVKMYQLVSFLSSYVVVEKPELFAEAYEPAASEEEGEARQMYEEERRELAKETQETQLLFSSDLLLSTTLSPMRIKPGILALVDDVDVEVLGGMEAPVPPGSCVTFISTLHGG
ncbi:ubiquitin related modifier protein [Toxoplasma gondii ME49]|uniref:Ubiquitin-related modifier 1 n=3 Tax=Toxoplasma gondii TaxID=5811 RepID=B6KK06_TOXGV|nr:ubiquitin related modifier protein [Toxoplasma gondii ME49]EPT28789.1 ubiquitin related modifier protein [Toxoplasma gondii ME49]ESS35864.1 ubiquitin related modifier protein [Toxoplasma gondii VEG]KYF46298.1 ubiquitin related modifier protein [Toxoplasma gondii ARI]CEL74984.1 TPA: Ubiquitin-related modifier 1 homolog [Toxoplasma gondii VEG]|eukprot:XP_002368179.1 ubiquitin related modifier protein [Toxoplasma gondii ME49]